MFLALARTPVSSFLFIPSRILSFASLPEDCPSQFGFDLSNFSNSDSRTFPKLDAKAPIFKFSDSRLTLRLRKVNGISRSRKHLLRRLQPPQAHPGTHRRLGNLGSSLRVKPSDVEAFLNEMRDVQFSCREVNFPLTATVPFEHGNILG